MMLGFETGINFEMPSYSQMYLFTSTRDQTPLFGCVTNPCEHNHSDKYTGIRDSLHLQKYRRVFAESVVSSPNAISMSHNHKATGDG